MMRKKSKFIQWFFIAIGILALTKMYYETKMMDLTIGILGLEMGHKDIYRVSCKSLMYITKKDVSDIVFLETMKEKGFNHCEVYGRGHLFEKNGEEILVIEKEHCNRYKVFEVQNKHYFLSFEEA
jgi:hypothetical protein